MLNPKNESSYPNKANNSSLTVSSEHYNSLSKQLTDESDITNSE